VCNLRTRNRNHHVPQRVQTPLTRADLYPGIGLCGLLFARYQHTKRLRISAKATQNTESTVVQISCTCVFHPRLRDSADPTHKVPTEDTGAREREGRPEVCIQVRHVEMCYFHKAALRTSDAGCRRIVSAKLHTPGCALSCILHCL
jgi:hypothetical protein